MIAFFIASVVFNIIFIYLIAINHNLVKEWIILKATEYIKKQEVMTDQDIKEMIEYLENLENG